MDLLAIRLRDEPELTLASISSLQRFWTNMIADLFYSRAPGDLLGLIGDLYISVRAL